MTTRTSPPAVPQRVGHLLRILPPGLYAGGARRLVERSLLVNRRAWLAVVSGLCEPLFYLFGLGYGFGTLVGEVTGPDGRPISYIAFVAPALLAASAMNGAGFLGVMFAMGLPASPWALLVLPAALLVAFAFAAVGMAATTFMRSWTDFDLVELALMPMFLFSTTFFPLSVYPPAVAFAVQCFPLYHAIEVMRALTTGLVDVSIVGHLAYFVVVAAIGVVVASRRLAKLLLR